MIAGVGIDVVEIARLERALARTQRLAGRLFTEAERDLPVRSLAARFAAKEALAKALGGPRGLLWTDAEITVGAAGRPELKVYRTVADAAARLGVTRWHVSLSHDGGLATAIVVAEAQVAEAQPESDSAPSGLGWV
jgi:holo-[acyl-carrier protein] synthase